MALSRAGGAGTTVDYDAFISYSHAADGDLARHLQSGLESLVKPWYRRRPFLRVFRDETSFAAGTDLGARIRAALDSAGNLILLLSPEAARSPWVDAELRHWLETRSKDDITIVVTDWDGTGAIQGAGGRSVGAAEAFASLGGFDWASENVPPSIRGLYTEPLAVDMRWARQPAADGALSLADEQFEHNVAEVAASVMGVNKDELIGTVVGMRTRARILTGTIALGALILLLAILLAGSGWLSARRAEQQARDNESAAIERQAAAELAAQESEAAAQEAAQLESEARAAQRDAEAAKDEADTAAAEAIAARAEADAAAAAADTARQDAERLRDEAVVDAEQADAARSTAEAARQDAERRQAAAEAAQEEAEQARSAADAARVEAEQARAQADAAATEATRRQAAAEDAQRSAEAAQQAAEQQQRDAEVARDAAVTAQRNAETARDTALAAQRGAEDAQQAAEHQQAIEASLATSSRLATFVDELVDADLSLAHLLAVESTAAGLRAQDLIDRPPTAALAASVTEPGMMGRLPTPVSYRSLLTALGHQPRQVFQLEGPDVVVGSLAFTGDGRAIVARTRTGLVYWDAATGGRLDQLPDGTAVPLDCDPAQVDRRTMNTCLAEEVDSFVDELNIADDGALAVVVSSAGSVQLHRRAANATGCVCLADFVPLGQPFPLPEPEGTTFDFPQIAFSPDSGLLAASTGPISGDANLTRTGVTVWRTGTPAPMPAVAATPPGLVRVVDISLSGDVVAGLDADDQLVVWDGSESRVLPAQRDAARTARITPDGGAVVVGGVGSLTVFDLADDTSTPIGHATPEYPDELSRPRVFAADGSMMIAAIPEHFSYVGLVDLDAERVVLSFDSGTDHPDSWTAALGVALPSGTRLAVVASGNEFPAENIRVYDIGDPAEPEVLLRTLDACTDDVSSLGCNLPNVTEVAISPDGATLATMTRTRDVKIWSYDDGTRSIEEVAVLSGHRPVTHIRFDSTGRLLFVGHDDGSLRMWDIDLPVTSLGPPLHAHSGPIEVIVQPPGTTTVITSDGAQVLEWSLGVDALVTAACARANRPLTDLETASYLPSQTSAVCTG